MDKKTTLSKPFTVSILAFICCFLWGSAIPMIKTGYDYIGIDNGNTASQILFAGARFTVAGIMVTLAGMILSPKSINGKKCLFISKSLLKYAFILCLFQTVGQYFFFYIGVAHTTGVTGSILNATGTFFAIVIACLIFRQEKLTPVKIAGCIIGFAGVLVINITGGSTDFGFDFSGEGFMVISTIMSALSSVLIKRFSSRQNPVFLSGCQFFMGGSILLAAGLIMGGQLSHITPAAVAVLLYLALVSAVAYTLWSVLLKYNPVSRIAVYGFMNPVCGVFLSAVILGEAGQAFRVESVIALIFVSIGIYIVNRKKGTA